MLKKEIIWREILFQAIEKNKYNFQQKELAKQFGFSLSTVFGALQTPRDIKAIKVSSRGFNLIDVEKLLYLWATKRKLEKEILYKTFVSELPAKIESNLPNNIIWGLFSAYQYKFKQSPSDYDKAYVYADKNILKEIQKRFPYKKGPENLFILKQDAFLKKYGNFGTLAQIFVDIWNTDNWYSQEFLKKLKIKMNL